MKKAIVISLSLLALLAFLLSACTEIAPDVSGQESSTASSAEASATSNPPAESSLPAGESKDPVSETEEPTEDQKVTQQFLEAVQNANNLYVEEPDVRYIEVSVRQEFLETDDWTPLFDSIQGPYTDMEIKSDDFLYFLRSCDKKIYHQQRYANAVFEDALMLYLVNPREGDTRDPLAECVKTATDLLDEWRAFLSEKFEQFHANGAWVRDEDTGDQVERFRLVNAETEETLFCHIDQESGTTVGYFKNGGSNTVISVKMRAGYPSEKLLFVTEEESAPFIAFEQFQETALALSGSFRGVEQKQ